MKKELQMIAHLSKNLPHVFFIENESTQKTLVPNSFFVFHN